MIGVILLAAGISERLGRPKQLLSYKGTTLLQYVIHVITAVIKQPVVLVLGARADEVQQSVGTTGVDVAINKDWQEGMASSIRYGVRAITSLQPAVEGLIIMVCDQPYVSPEIINALLSKRTSTGKKIIASTYNGSIGVPVLFDKAFFPLLLSLKGQEGAKKIVQQHPDDVETIAFPGGSIDIDTAEDYEELKQ